MQTTLDPTSLRDAAAFDRDEHLQADVVVLGSGAGGAVAAKELAEGGMRVVVLEEGGHRAENGDLASDAIRTLYRDGGLTTTLGAPFVPVPLGRCLGGTTTINSGTCFRTPEPVLAEWRTRFGLEEFTAEHLAGCFDRVERELGIAPAKFAVMSRSNTLVHELLEREGKHGAPLRRNAPDCEGCGMCCYGCTSGAKRGMARSYIPKAVAAGATVVLHARARQIRLNLRGAAAGVDAEAVDAAFHPTGRRIRVDAPKVIVACGTFLSPALLHANKLARGNRHLGRHLTIHPASKVSAEFDEVINSWNGIPQAYEYAGLHDDGILFEGISMPPDLGAIVPLHGARLAQYIANYRHVASFGFMIRDSAEGRMVRIPFGPYQFLYALNRADARRIRTAIAFLARLFLRGCARVAYAMVHHADNVFTTLEDVDRFEAAELAPGDIECMAFHPLGTCRMAGMPDLGVCDAYHQVFGAPGLYVCDGSVVPTPLGVNPQQTIMGLATRLAGHLLGQPLR